MNTLCADLNCTMVVIPYQQRITFKYILDVIEQVLIICKYLLELLQFEPIQSVLDWLADFISNNTISQPLI